MLTTFLSLALAAASCAGSPLVKSSRRDYAVFESVNIPSAWTPVSPAPASHVLNLRIGLKQSRQQELVEHLYEISDPGHHRYGQHLSQEEVNNLVAPLEETVTAVRAWLAEHGIESHQYTESPAKDWVSLSLPVEVAEYLLDTKYSVYEHEETGARTVRTNQYSLPASIHDHVDLVAPTVYFAGTKAQKSLKSVDVYPGVPVYTPRADGDLKGCNASAVTSGCLRALYNTYDYKPVALSKNAVGISGYLAEHANFADLQNFLTTERPEAAAANYKFGVQLINGGTNPQPYTPQEVQLGSGQEANLDVQTVAGFVYPTPFTFYSVGGSPPFQPDIDNPSNSNEPYLDFLNYVLAQKDLPTVFSNSYEDDEQTVPKSYAYRVCTGFAQLGARGVSVLFGSGDGGVSGVQSGGSCTLNDGKNTTAFLPLFPSSCPFITSVGATQGFSPEVAVNRSIAGFFSGGGFSSYFPTAPYQVVDVAAYVASLGGKFNGLYNPFGRAYPDIIQRYTAKKYGVAHIVSHALCRFLIAYNGGYRRIGGTSASTPAFSGVVALLNDYLLSQGKPPLGFLNPWLYSIGRNGLNDVLSGSAAGCNTTGFPAQKGWDAVSGLGTPDFLKLKGLL